MSFLVDIIAASLSLAQLASYVRAAKPIGAFRGEGLVGMMADAELFPRMLVSDTAGSGSGPSVVWKMDGIGKAQVASISRRVLKTHSPVLQFLSSWKQAPVEDFPFKTYIAV